MIRLAVGSGLPVRCDVPTYVWTGGHCLVLPFAGVTGAELRAVKKAQADFAIFEDGPVATLLFRFGSDIPWGDAAFNILDGGRVNVETIESILATSLADGSRSLLTAVLVEQRSRIIQAIRVTTLSEHMSEEMLAMLRRQIAHGPISDPEMRARVEAMYRSFPNSDDMLPVAAAQSIGGVA